MMPTRTVAIIAALVCAACVGPARSTETYSSKSGATAEGVLSAVNTARLAAHIGSGGLAFGPYVSVTISGAEDSARFTQGVFDSIQPPDAASDQIRHQLDPILTDAVNALGQLRIAARRNEMQRLDEIAAPLRMVSKQLDRFAKEHP
jgi:hypothetical protein